MSVDGWMDKEDVVHIYNGILLSYKKERIVFWGRFTLIKFMSLMKAIWRPFYSLQWPASFCLSALLYITFLRESPTTLPFAMLGSPWTMWALSEIPDMLPSPRALFLTFLPSLLLVSLSCFLSCFSSALSVVSQMTSVRLSLMSLFKIQHLPTLTQFLLPSHLLFSP